MDTAHPWCRPRVFRSPSRHHPTLGARTGTLALAVAVAVTVAACASDGGENGTIDVNSERVATRTLGRIVDGLCAAREQAGENREAAESTFFGRAHEPIHTLARAVQSTDRRAAGELLRAKQAVEADFRAGGDLEGDLERLVDETVEALMVLGIETKGCPR